MAKARCRFCVLRYDGEFFYYCLKLGITVPRQHKCRGIARAA